DISKLKLRFDVDSLTQLGKRQRALDHATVSLSLAHCNHQVAAAQICCDSCTPELGGGYDDIRRGKPQIEIKAGKAVEGDAAIIPCTLIGGKQTDRRDIGCEIERVGGERTLHRLPSISRKREHAFRTVAVEFNINTRQADRAAHYIGFR